MEGDKFPCTPEHTIDYRDVSGSSSSSLESSPDSTNSSPRRQLSSFKDRLRRTLPGSYNDEPAPIAYRQDQKLKFSLKRPFFKLSKNEEDPAIPPKLNTSYNSIDHQYHRHGCRSVSTEIPSIMSPIVAVDGKQLDFDSWNSGRPMDHIVESLAGMAVAEQACHRALFVPEIVNLILRYVDDSNTIPHEVAQRRRKPMSLRHAMLIYRDPQVAKAAWEKSQAEDKSGAANSEDEDGGLFSCMLVSRLWYSIAHEILQEKVYFKDQALWEKFVNVYSERQIEEADKPSVLVLHKLIDANQSDVDSISDKVGGKLKWLEFYTCTAIVPTKPLLKGGALTKIVLPGCARVTDSVVAMIADYCPQLEHLDLRACDYVTDRGLKALAKKCSGLRMLNVGRTQRGELITYRGIKHIARRTAIDTLGLAGCAIDDRAIWELAIHRGKFLQRLSLNNCHLLTNNSIPKVLGYARNLCVLELRGCLQITDMKPILQFKRYRELRGVPPLIEGCETFELRMKEAEWLMEIEISRQVISDCLEWIYSKDSDAPTDQFKRQTHQHVEVPLNNA